MESGERSHQTAPDAVPTANPLTHSHGMVDAWSPTANFTRWRPASALCFTCFALQVGRTSLHLAVQQSRLEAMTMLERLGAGVEVDVVDSEQSFRL